MLDSSKKSKSLIGFVNDIFYVLIPRQIFSKCHTQVFECISMFKGAVIDLDRNSV